MGNRTEKVDVKEDQVCDAACSLRTNCKNCTQVFGFLALLITNQLDLLIPELSHRVRACGVQIKIVVSTKTHTSLPFPTACAPSGQRTRTNAEIWTSLNLKRGARLDNETFH